MRTPPALKHETLTQTLHRYPVPFSSFDSFLLTARGALTVSRGGSYARGLIYDWFILAWTLGDIKRQSARSARVPISGPSYPTVAPVFVTAAPDYESAISTYIFDSMTALRQQWPCGDMSYLHIKFVCFSPCSGVQQRVAAGAFYEARQNC